MLLADWTKPKAQRAGGLILFVRQDRGLGNRLLDFDRGLGMSEALSPYPSWCSLCFPLPKYSLQNAGELSFIFSSVDDCTASHTTGLSDFNSLNLENSILPDD